MKKLYVLLVVLALAVIAWLYAVSPAGMIFLSNPWCTWFWKTFSTIIYTIPSAAAVILQIIAIFHPGVPTNSALALVQKWKNGTLMQSNFGAGYHLTP